MLAAQEISKLIASCNTSKDSWNSYYFEAMSYTQPERNYIWRVKGGFPGNTKQVPLFTQAGKVGTNIFTARIQNKLSPYEKPYLNWQPKKSLDAEYVKELRDFCAVMSDKCNERKNELKLDDQLNDSYYDLACGTAMIAREDTLSGIDFKKIPITDYKLGSEKNQTVVRDYKMNGYQIGITFPELANLKYIGGMDVKGSNKYEEIQLTDILYLNEKTKKWEYYVQYGSETLLTRTYKQSPFHIFHWTRAADMPFGSGVALQALPAIKRLNSFIKVNLELIPYAFPMFLTTSGNFMDRNVNFKPGGIINVRDINAMQPIQLSQAKNDFEFEIQREELEIKQTFLDYTLPTSPRQMTAAEVYARSNPQDEMVAMNVSKLTSVLKEIAWDIFDDVFDREIGNTVSFTKEQVKELLDCNINNEANLDTATIEKMNSYIQSLLAFDPQALWQTIDRGKALEIYGDAYNLPIDMRKTADEIDELYQQASESQAAELQSQINAQMAIDTNKEAAIAQRESEEA